MVWITNDKDRSPAELLWVPGESTKHQAPSSREAPNSKFQTETRAEVAFGIYMLIERPATPSAASRMASPKVG